ncbi:mRNA guanylyltransferase NDAI_0I00830 [Naumovozyma dairenensis CBS 421]|uniref:mRNA-capping enzyme subunit alpha n=1 Tax=Naumovozyma dairenensis (strain ATCC 10597 / BCRC 20456 / CBS 421 / NBRC 0211 / NRRL Y-12639) TaxID=1071378 RepID=G0WFU1_NAUDC|nr:hypothetical protein NDAI_0I00830 [Naumovozyma dairenensis CBS 421]CCD26652.1 hypothetical protein NDAI_0I00830 [Naumovozyma dairenensis CBS 421]
MDNRAAPEIPGLIQPGNVTQDLKMMVCNLLNSPKPLKTFPGSQPVSFQHSDMEEKLMEKDYYVCEKTDGLRVLMLILINPITREQGTFMIDRENNYYLVNGFRFPIMYKKKKEELLEKLQDGTIIDGELVLQTNPATKMKELRYLAFDCLAINGRSLVQSPTDKRLGHLNNEFYMPYFELRKYYEQDYCRTFPFKISPKRMDFSYRLMRVADSLDKLPHMSDGLIFTPISLPYQLGGKDSNLLKWKPEEENSVDFKLILDIPMVEDPSLPKKDPNRWYYNYDVKPTFQLHVWLGGADVNTRLEHFDEPFSKKELDLLERTYKKFAELNISDEHWQELKNMEEPLNGRIVECTKDQETGQWIMLRFRDDKLNGNHTSVVQKVLESINDSVTIEDLGDVVPRIKSAWDERHRHKAETSRNASNGNSTWSQPAVAVARPTADEAPKYVDEGDWSD